MPAYYDKTTKKWYCKFYYMDYTNTKRQKLKRGFTSKRDALEYERTFLVKYQKDATISFSVLIGHYKEDIKARLKASTVSTKSYIINNRIFPYFKGYTVDQITTGDVRKWQNNIIKQGYSNTYINTVNKQLVAIFNFAIKFYGLQQNPATLAGNIGAKKPDKEMNILTPDQFDILIESVDNIEIKTIFTILFYSGLRIGELQALTWNDIDMQRHMIQVNKTFTKIKGKEVITTPKTRKSVRSVSVPSHAIDLLLEYKKRLYEPKNRVFSISRSGLRSALNKATKANDLPHIRIHDLRHSHASLLINHNINILAISERLGHESIDTTLNTYGHLYPSRKDEIIDLLENISKK